MKATIAKDNDFKTVGFEVTSNGKTVFSWGCKPLPALYYCKEINCKDWETEILTLIEARERLTIYKSFTCLWFEAAIKDSGMNADGLALKHDSMDARIEKTISLIENIINNIS